MMENSPDFLYEKTNVPTREQLEDLMGKAAPLYSDFLMFIRQQAGEVTPEWKFYSRKSGWTCKHMLCKRNLFFFKPLPGAFAVTYIFGDRATGAVLNSDLPKAIRDELDAARKFAEGRGLRLIIRTPGDLEVAERLLNIKLKF